MTTNPNYVSPLNPQGAASHTFKIGDIEIFQIFDGAASRDLDAGAFKNVSAEEVNAALTAEGFPEGRIPNSYTITLARIGGELVMFDSGNGEGGQPKSGHLRDNMRAAGLDPKDISKIVMTHLHPDHVFGLMTKDNEQVYPDIEILIPEAEYAFWTDPASLDTLPASRLPLARRIQATLPTWKNVGQYRADQDVLPGIHAISTPGHTPGHTSLLLNSSNAQLIVMADVTNIPVFNMHHPDWHLSADQDPLMAAQTRHRMLDRVSADRIVCTGYHWGMPGAGTIEKTATGYALHPVDMK